MEHGPWNLPISQKMHFQPYFSIKNLNDSQAWTRVIQMNWRSSGIMPENQGNASSAMTPLPPVSKGSPRPQEMNRALGLLVEVVLSSCFSTVVAPFERVKLLMQSQNALIQSGRLSKPYKGIFDCFATTIRNEGVISLWRGNTARIMGQNCSKVILATLSYIKSQKGQLDYPWLVIVGSCAAVILVPYPLHYAGIRLANDVKTTAKVGKWKFGGMVDVYRQTMRSDGIQGMYRGFMAASIRYIINRKLYRTLEQGQLIQLLGLQVSGDIYSSIVLTTGAEALSFRA
ncbi:Mitochondrial carrier protein [Corchorus olitorius]|uniref:ADP/ATP translocase n=1 Tax=Corchorus olitorius TaxID=93759 RepID=A0A1R3H4E1_9ROSI|nr:Mitochondrial carrier protein [Corchorus olitorius]